MGSKFGVVSIAQLDQPSSCPHWLEVGVEPYNRRANPDLVDSVVSDNEHTGSKGYPLHLRSQGSHEGDVSFETFLSEVRTQPFGR
jgi:hypothetical protein